MKTLQSYMVNESVSTNKNLIKDIVVLCEQLRGSENDLGKGVINVKPGVRLDEQRKGDVMLSEINGNYATLLDCSRGEEMSVPLTCFDKSILFDVQMNLVNMVAEL